MTQRTWTPFFAAVCTSSKDAQLPDDTCRLFYDRLLTQVDSYGCVALSEHVLHAKVWPLHGKPLSETSRSIQECSRAGLFTVHEEGGRRWLFVPDWEEKAGRVLRLDRRGSRDFPEPTDGNRVEYSRSIPDHSGSTPEHSNGLQAHSGRLPDSHSRAERERQRDQREREPRGERVRERGGAPRRPPAAAGDWQAILPEHPRLDTPEVRTALGEWVEHRREQRLVAWKAVTWRKNLQVAEDWGPTGLVESIGQSIRAPWRGLFPPKPNGHKSDREREPAPLPDGPTYWAAERAKFEEQCRKQEREQPRGEVA